MPKNYETAKTTVDCRFCDYQGVKVSRCGGCGLPEFESAFAHSAFARSAFAHSVLAHSVLAHLSEAHSFHSVSRTPLELPEAGLT